MAGATPAHGETKRKPILDDPYLWLEEVEGERALEWVHARNKECFAELEADARYGKFLSQAEKLLNAKDRIPYGSIRGKYVYNFWQDAEHVRGIMRRTTPESYRLAKPEWETVLDIDALAKAEDENWVYKGTTWLAPDYERCLIKLSRGGTDASVHREFDTLAKRFVEGGFALPEAKSGVTWLDRDTLLVGTDWGEGSLTESGYPRVAKRWKRGTPLAKATTIFEGRHEDIGIWPRVMDSGEETIALVDQSLTFFTGAYHVIGPDGEMTRLPLQESADLAGFYAGRLIFTLREAWEVDGQTHAQGALLAINAAVFQATGKLPTIETIYTPDERTSIEGVTVSRSGLYVTLLQNVKGRILRFSVDPQSGQWSSKPVPLPENGTVSISAAGPHSETIFINYEDHVTPDRLSEFDAGANKLSTLKSLAARFDAGDLEVHQHMAKSADGTAVPYFVIHRKGLKPDGSTPTILYGYGGFEISLKPSYSATIGKLWLERGGAYAVANIRGGGEFGPRWHKAALKTERQRAYDDFIAVGEDLAKRGITSPKHLGISGGSNGGLLVGAIFTQRPDLLNAVVCRVPLLDMIRYTKLLAGASWAAEYGDPEDPKMREAILRYSPYQNVFPDKKYPKVFIETSTKDDRVHPGHARKMVARMREQGHEVLYYENTEGGHAAGANLKQHARRYALEYVYFSRQLGLE
ncbi:MAG: prolyl oligopeptidase family serine peptidase [Verrucomicrobiales bacterium]|nr:prolyl oligopeptidase family serine peptidase [Verrucomicrobiales bacterium]